MTPCPGVRPRGLLPVQEARAPDLRETHTGLAGPLPGALVLAAKPSTEKNETYLLLMTEGASLALALI